MNPQQAAMVQAAMANAKAQQAMYAGINTNVDGKSGSEVMALVLQGNPGLLTKFSTNPQLYQDDPEAVHRNIGVFLKADANVYAHLFLKISAYKPSVLAPHAQHFMNLMVSNPNTATLTIQILDGIAKENPDLIQPFMPQIIKIVGGMQSGAIVYCKLASKMAACTIVRNAPDYAFGLLVDILRKPIFDNYTAGCVIAEIANIMTIVSDRQIIRDALPLLTPHRSSNEVTYGTIVDYANDRSLQKVSEKVDVLEKKVNALNADVSRTCANMSDVIAYVDANMADMKDFLAEVVKKLPQPARLQIDGTLRKTLILVFVCCDTGLEYGITSTEWNKWLKIGFSLVKAGQCIIDVGMGNPLGIIKKGVECVQEIYTAYKTNDDDEFNTYITQPFLTSSEQDKLLEKLREQKFFEKFAYNAQKHGWYLLNPQKDGATRFNQADQAVRDGISGAVTGLVGAAVNALPISGDTKDAINSVTSAGVSAASGSIKANESAKLNNSSANTTSDSTTNPMVKGASGQQYQSGGRAAALKESYKETFGAGVVAEADAKVQVATVQASNNAEFLKRMETMEAEIVRLKSKVNALEQKKPEGCCVIA